MPFFDLVDRDGHVVQQIIAATVREARASWPARHDARIADAVPSGTYARGDAAGQGQAGARLVEVAEARLAEAFERLGLSPRAVGHALSGRDSSSVDRLRRQRLVEAGVGGSVELEPNSVYRHGRKLNRADVDRLERDRHEASRRAVGTGWGAENQTLDVMAKQAEIAATLVKAGYDPSEVARALGIPVARPGVAPVPAKAAAPERPSSTTPAAEPAPTPMQAAESARTSGDSELVELREVTPLEDRVQTALDRAFGPTGGQR